MGGWQVPGYTEVAELGSGGSGRVVAAVDVATGERVAIKYLADWLAGEQRFRDAFRAEAGILAGLQLPNVVGIRRYVEWAGGAAIVMQLVDGVSLRAMLKAAGPAGPLAAAAVLRGSLLGLAGAHARGIVHRDYKPENVIVDAGGSSMLVDFGIAARAGTPNGPAGTPGYMAPEQWAGGPATPATDIFAAAVTYAECLTGVPPPARPPLAAVGQDAPTATVGPAAQPGGVQPGGARPGGDPVAALIARATAVAPADRPGSAAEFLTELELAAHQQYGADWAAAGRAALARAAALTAGAAAGAAIAAAGAGHAAPAAAPVARATTRLGRSGGRRAARAAARTGGKAGLGHGAIAGIGAAAAVAVTVGAVVTAVIAHHHSPPAVQSLSSATAGPWGHAIEVPGMALLNAGGSASISSVSCAAGGSCVAGGSYADGLHHGQAFVVTERHGRWGTAIEVPGTASLNAGATATNQGAGINSVSCPAVGSCAAGGWYTGASGHWQAFVVTQRHGRWGTAIEVPGLAAMNTGGNGINSLPSDLLDSMACATAGNCLAGGSYTNGAHHGQAFVVSEQHGRWGRAIEIPGTAALNVGAAAPNGPNAGVSSVACVAAGSCAVGGWYIGASGIEQVFVATERHGRWGTAIEVPGLAALNTATSGVGAGIGSLACAAAGSCAAGGWYTDSAGREQAFVVSEQDGRWETAIEVPGTAALTAGATGRAGGLTEVSSVSCPAPGNCTAGGSYSAGTSIQAFVVSERHGRWGTAIEVPGTAALNSAVNGFGAGISSVACWAVGNCAAGGYYANSTGIQVFVVSERRGLWGTAIEVPGTAALNTGATPTNAGARITSAACTAGSCAAGGWYTDSAGSEQAFVVSKR